MDPALVIRRELPGDEQPTRALHEAAFGVLETDVQERVRPGVMRQAAPQR